MKRLLYISILSMLTTLLLASAAAAQGVAPGGGSGPYGCPEDMPFVASDPDDPGEASLLCFATEEEAAAYSAGELTGEEPPTTTGGQYEDEVQPPATPQAETPDVPDTTTPALPDTGGPALLLPVAGLLLTSGLIGLTVVRRRP